MRLLAESLLSTSAMLFVDGWAKKGASNAGKEKSFIPNTERTER